MKEIIGKCLECGEEVDYEEDHLTSEGECLCHTCKEKYVKAAYKIIYSIYEGLPPLMKKAMAEENAIGLLYKDIQDEAEDL